MGFGATVMMMALGAAVAAASGQRRSRSRSRSRRRDASEWPWRVKTRGLLPAAKPEAAAWTIRATPGSWYRAAPA